MDVAPTRTLVDERRKPGCAWDKARMDLDASATRMEARRFEHRAGPLWLILTDPRRAELASADEPRRSAYTDALGADQLGGAVQGARVIPREIGTERGR